MQKKQLQPHTRTYTVHSLNSKVFSNTKRPTKGYLGIEVDLFPAMLNVPSPEPLPSRITSSPSLSFEPTPDHTTTAASSTSAPQHTEPSPTAEEHVPTSHDSP
ncbi:hypothetical protein Tco_0498515, partial [Tanacetum coccineum]